eukprot:TRINITY_DN4370_c1_g1_i2.p1 TRINITY_DN4370_c1_g1~~TRINITY_DN4370_c1_g1_i2.p1  ORF type:complete len:513 (+),score=70.55 TRINITY_DN4370_c1_g1_i2:688-2226(+)
MMNILQDKENVRTMIIYASLPTRAEQPFTHITTRDVSSDCDIRTKRLHSDDALKVQDRVKASLALLLQQEIQFSIANCPILIRFLLDETFAAVDPYVWSRMLAILLSILRNPTYTDMVAPYIIERNSIITSILNRASLCEPTWIISLLGYFLSHKELREWVFQQRLVERIWKIFLGKGGNDQNLENVDPDTNISNLIQIMTDLLAPGPGTQMTLAGNRKVEIGDEISFFSDEEEGMELLASTFDNPENIKEIHKAMFASKKLIVQVLPFLTTCISTFPTQFLVFQRELCSFIPQYVDLLKDDSQDSIFVDQHPHHHFGMVRLALMQLIVTLLKLQFDITYPKLLELEWFRYSACLIQEYSIHSKLHHIIFDAFTHVLQIPEENLVMLDYVDLVSLILETEEKCLKARSFKSKIKPKRRQFLSSSTEEELSPEDLEKLFSFETKCAYFGHLKSLAAEMHRLGKTDEALKAKLGAAWPDLKRLSQELTESLHTTIPVKNTNKRFRLYNSVGELF